MWGVKTETIRVIVAATLGAMPHSMKENKRKNRTGSKTTDIRAIIPEE